MELCAYCDVVQIMVTCCKLYATWLCQKDLENLFLTWHLFTLWPHLCMLWYKYCTVWGSPSEVCLRKSCRSQWTGCEEGSADLPEKSSKGDFSSYVPI